MHVIEHGHHHNEEQGEITPVVLLAHMVEHNHNHIHELEELASHLNEETRNRMAPAIAAIRDGNDQLATILAEIKEN